MHILPVYYRPFQHIFKNREINAHGVSTFLVKNVKNDQVT